MDNIIFLTSLFIPVSTILNGEGTICGREINNNFHIENKIVGGYDLGYYKYPWFATLERMDSVYCAGSLIGSKTILTAAHCYHEYLNDTKIKLEDIYHVKLGTYNHCEKEKSQKNFTVAKVIIHDQYKEKWPYYDIAILLLKESTTGFDPICLTKSLIKTKPREGKAPGLGTLKYGGKMPCTVHEARLLIYSDNECKKMIKHLGNDPIKFYKALCAGYLEGGIDTCQGDSGGPLQIQDEYGNYYLLGIVSFGFECAVPNRLGIYTDASAYITWIEEKSGIQTTIDNSNSTTGESFTVATTSNTKSTSSSTRTIPTTKTTGRIPFVNTHHHNYVMISSNALRPRPPIEIFIFNQRAQKRKQNVENTALKKTVKQKDKKF